MKKNNKKISRKTFIKRSCKGISGIFAYSAFPRLFKDTDSLFRQKNLGRCGITVSEVGFGAARIMEPSLLLNAVEQGMNFIDTGRSYFNGNNEKMIGNALNGIRKKLVIQSKIKIRVKGRTEIEITTELNRLFNESLTALQTDYIDILLIHNVSQKEVIGHHAVQNFLTSVKKEGMIRAHGFSSHNEPDLLEYANESKFYDVIMNPYNHRGAYKHMNTGSILQWNQPAAEKQFRKAHQNGIGIIAMKTCSGGPYAFGNAKEKTFPGAVQWALSHDFIGTAAVAMTNTGQIAEYVSAWKNWQR